jgi:predicted TIM-barrel fold metal-dependent hydrolase
MTLEIIDIHPHIISKDTAKYPPDPLRGLQSDWSAERPLTFEQFVAQMDAAGVAKTAIVHASTYYGFNNSYVADSIATDPKRFAGVYSIDVRAPDAVKVFDGWLKRGMSGLRIFTGGATHATEADWLDDPATFPVWERCVETNIPVCIQTSQPGIPKTRVLAEKFPKAKIILDHLARPTLTDGPPYAAAQTLWDLAAYPNLYMKISPRTFDLVKQGKASAATFFPKLVEAFGAGRIAFGSNLPANEGTMSSLVAQGKECLACLSQADQEMIWGGTAKTLYPVLA